MSMRKKFYKLFQFIRPSNSLLAFTWAEYRIWKSAPYMPIMQVFLVLLAEIIWATTQLKSLKIAAGKYADPPEYDESTFSQHNPVSLSYCPRSLEIDLLMERTYKNFMAYGELIPYADCRDMEINLFKWQYTKASILQSISAFGVQFQTVSAQAHLMEYTIRSNLNFPTDREFPSLQPLGPVYNNSEFYIDTGFIALQYGLDNQFLKLCLGDLSYYVNIAHFPHPPIDLDEDVLAKASGYAVTLQYFVRILLVFTLFRNIHGRKSGSRGVHAMMGLTYKKIWLLEAVQSTGLMSLSILPLAIHAHVCITPHIPIYLLCLYLFLFIQAMSQYTSFVASLFADRSFALTAYWLLTSMDTFVNMQDTTNMSYKILFCLTLPSVTWIYIFEDLTYYEIRKIKPTLWDFRPLKFNLMPPLIGALVLIAQFIIFFLLAEYVRAIYPGNYEDPRHWYFPLQCFRRRKLNRVTPSVRKDDNFAMQGASFEKLPSVQIRSLWKVERDLIGRETEIIKGVSINLYYDQITAILGKLGSGKTSLVSLITGREAYSSGEIQIDGTVITDTWTLRSLVGSCNDKAIFIHNLNLYQQILYCSLLRGVARESVRERTIDLLTKVGLEKHQEAYVKDLPIFMRKKFFIAMAMTGDPKILVFDEPTKDLDQRGKNDIWQIMTKLKHGRTVIITTEKMSEADFLADRVAILTQGYIISYGNLYYLKTYYRIGYTLTIRRLDYGVVNEIEEYVLQYLPLAVLKNTVFHMMRFILPLESVSKFKDFFVALGPRKADLGIDSVEISIVPLDEIYLTIVEAYQSADASHYLLSHMLKQKAKSDAERRFKKCEKIFKILFRRNWLCCIRERGLLVRKFVQFVLVMVMIAILKNRNEIYPQLTDRVMDLSNVRQSIVYYHSITSELEYVDALSYYATEKRAKLIRTEEFMVTELEQLALDDYVRFHDNVMVGIEMIHESEILSIRAFYNGISYHAISYAVNAVSNMVIKEHLGLDARIITHNHPYLDRSKATVSFFEDAPLAVFVWHFVLPLTLLLISLEYITRPMTERISLFRHLLHLAGASTHTYWNALFALDITIYSTSTGLIILLLYASGCIDIYDLLHMAILVILYGFSAIMLVYILSFIDMSISTLYWGSVCINLFAYGLAFALQWYRNHYPTLFAIVDSILMLTPSYALSMGLLSMGLISFDKKLCNFVSEFLDCSFQYYANQRVCCKIECGKEGCDFYILYYDNLLTILQPMIMLILDFIIHLLILISLVKEKKSYKKVKDIPFIPSIGDTDVNKEKKRANALMKGKWPSEVAFVATDLVKVYRRNVILKGLNFVVEAGRCFGLCGEPGSGLEEVLNILAGLDTLNDGDALLFDESIVNNKREYMKKIGYCPANDSLITNLTGREIITLFASISGLKGHLLYTEVEFWITYLGLAKIQNDYCANYSVGMRRKMGVVIAFLTNSPVLFLEHPTKEIDPISKHGIYALMEFAEISGRSIIMSSDNMNDCELLCTRMGIIVEGQFKCIGPIQHLKERFGLGYTAIIKTRTVNEIEFHKKITDLKSDLTVRLTGQLRPGTPGVIHYSLMDPKLNWDSIFRTMELLKLSHDIIEDYAITECSVQEMYIHFTKNIKKKVDAVRILPGRFNKRSILRRFEPQLTKVGTRRSTITIQDENESFDSIEACSRLRHTRKECAYEQLNLARPPMRETCNIS